MKRYLLFTVYVSVMTTLGAELAASRLIGNVFGTSNIVWVSIIGLILIYLTFGYFLGGKWADAHPTPGAMYRILAWVAFTLWLVPYIASPVLRVAATAFGSRRRRSSWTSRSPSGIARARTRRACSPRPWGTA